MINSLKRMVCFRSNHKWGAEAFVSPDSCQMGLTCQRCGDVRRTQLVHTWQEGDYAAADSCQILNVCQRCGASQPGRIQHTWDEVHLDDQIAQKCRRCGQVQMAWPELEAVVKTEIAATAVEIKDQVASVNETENVKLQPLVSHWGPIVTHLLERVAALTTDWHAPLTYATVVPLNIARSIRDDNRIVWRANYGIYMEFSGSDQYFAVTLAVTGDYEPLNFQVLSKSFRFRTAPNIECLKAALVRAYMDGPAFSHGSIGGYACSEIDAQEETIP